MLLPPTPETAAAFFGDVEGRRDPAVDVRALRRRGDPPPGARFAAEGARHQRGQRRPRRARLVEHVLILDDELLGRGSTTFDVVDTAADDPAQLYYSSGTTGLAKGIVHAHRYLLAHEEFIYCHDVRDGERFHGMGEWAWAAGICPLLGPWRLGAVQCVYQREGGLRPAQAARLPLAPRGHATCSRTPTAIRSMMSITDARTRYPQRFRIVCSAGEPLNPEAIRWFREQYGVTVLDYYGLTESYPLCGNFPFMEVREGSMGRPMPGLGSRDPRRGRAARAGGRARRDLPARAVEPALPARLLEPAGGGQRGDVRRRVVPHQGRGPRSTRTATSGTRAAPTT